MATKHPVSKVFRKLHKDAVIVSIQATESQIRLLQPYVPPDERPKLREALRRLEDAQRLLNGGHARGTET